MNLDSDQDTCTNQDVLKEGAKTLFLVFASHSRGGRRSERRRESSDPDSISQIGANNGTITIYAIMG